MTNEEFAARLEKIEKSIITTADGGKLNPKQSDKFIDYVVDLSGLKDQVRVERFRNEQMYIDKIGVHSRVAMAATEATDPTERRGVSTSRLPLQPKEIIVPFEISKSFLENNIEGDDIEDRIVRMMADQLANDLEELYIFGDVLGAGILESEYREGGSTTDYVKDTYMALADGWLRQADDGNLLDVENKSISADVFSRMLNQMPSKFKRNVGDLRFICSQSLDQLYRQKFGTRETGDADEALNSQKPMKPFGVPLMPFPLFPHQPEAVQHVVLTGTTAVALRYKPIESGSEVVTLSTLGATPTTPYVEGTDYDMDYALGTITRNAGGSIISGATVKVTYQVQPQLLLTKYQNLILAIGRDIEIDTDKNIFKRVKQYAITVKADVLVEEDTAVVKGYNISKTI